LYVSLPYRPSGKTRVRHRIGSVPTLVTGAIEIPSTTPGRPRKPTPETPTEWRHPCADDGQPESAPCSWWLLPSWSLRRPRPQITSTHHAPWATAPRTSTTSTSSEAPAPI